MRDLYLRHFSNRTDHLAWVNLYYLIPQSSEPFLQLFVLTTSLHDDMLSAMQHNQQAGPPLFII